MDQRQDLIVCDPFCSANPKNKRGGRWTTSRLHVLGSTEADYSTVERQFYDGWKHPHKRKPRIKTIFRIISPPSFHMPYYQHRSAFIYTCRNLSVVISSRDRVCIDLPDISSHTFISPNEQFLFHGTDRACSLGEDPASTNLCMLPECHLCCIVRNSFDISKCGQKNKFRRFGTGIYATSVSSKADDYIQNINRLTPIRAVLLNRVVVGNPERRLRNAIYRTAPLAGCHSIIGEPGADLNYEETVVYNNDAIRPAFLVVYVDNVQPLKPKPKFQAVLKSLFHTPIAT